MESNLSSHDSASAMLRKFSLLIGKMARQELIRSLDAAGIDLLPHQFMVLAAIGEQTITLGELSRERGLDASTLAPIIEQLVRRGLVERNRDPHDRRRVPLNLTAEGIKLLTVVRQINKQNLFVRSFALMGEEKEQQLLLLLEEFVRNLLTLNEESEQSDNVLPEHGR
jgi:DNA-binding MarR family transcriptional regulator